MPGIAYKVERPLAIISYIESKIRMYLKIAPEQSTGRGPSIGSLKTAVRASFAEHCYYFTEGIFLLE